MKRGRNWLLIAVLLAVALVLVGVGLLVILRPSGIPADALLTFDLREELPEEQDLGVVERLLGWHETTVYDVVRGLDAAASEPRIRAALIRVATLDCGLARVQEVRQAVARFRESGRPVAVLIERGGISDYYLATAADRVYLLPGGTLNITGLVAEVPFARGSLERIGIVPDFERQGEHKNSPEVYTRHDMSQSMRQDLERVLTGLSSRMLDDIATDRNIPLERLREIVEEGYMGSMTALDAGLIDDTLYADEAREDLAATLGVELKDTRLEDYLDTLGSGWFSRPPRVAVVYATGAIVPGESLENDWVGRLAGAETLSRLLREVREDDRVKAVVLRVNSPGGSGWAADLIWREATLTAEQKPLVVSMGDYAASGGYYIALAADEVIAQPGTLTGSIGVFSGKFAMQGLYDWVGLGWGTVKTADNADLFNDRTPWTPAQRRMIRRGLEEFYAQFVDRVADGRGLERESVLPLATGQVFTGEEALDLGLVDALGGLREAIQAGRELAGLAPEEAFEVESYPRRRGWMTLMSGQAGGAAGPLPGRPEAVLREAALWQLLAREPVSAYWPGRLAAP